MNEPYEVPRAAVEAAAVVFGTQPAGMPTLLRALRAARPHLPPTDAQRREIAAQALQDAVDHLSVLWEQVGSPGRHGVGMAIGEVQRLADELSVSVPVPDVQPAVQWTIGRHDGTRRQLAPGVPHDVGPDQVCGSCGVIHYVDHDHDPVECGCESGPSVPDIQPRMTSRFPKPVGRDTVDLNAPEAPADADGELDPDERLLFDLYRHLDCPAPVDPADRDDCANVAAESIRVLRAAGRLQPALDVQSDRGKIADQVFAVAYDLGQDNLAEAVEYAFRRGLHQGVEIGRTAAVRHFLRYGAWGGPVLSTEDVLREAAEMDAEPSDVQPHQPGFAKPVGDDRAGGMGTWAGPQTLPGPLGERPDWEQL